MFAVADETMRQELEMMMKDVNKDAILDKVEIRLVGDSYPNLPEFYSRRWLDLNMIYVYDISDKYAMKITENNIDGFGIDPDLLHTKALENTRNKEMYLTSLSMVVAGDEDGHGVMIGTTGADGYGEYGSSILLTHTIQEHLLKIDMDAFILPSSVHEVLVVPDTGDIDVAALKATVMQVNRTNVDASDKLSDSVYYMNGETGEITIAA